MINRQLEKWLDSVRDRPQAVHVMGMRQTGKTTLFNEYQKKFNNYLKFALQDLVELRRYESEPQRWVLEIESAIEMARSKRKVPLNIFIDEVQKIPALFQAIQGIYDKYKGDVKFWIWGSSARPQKRLRAETLAGRVLIKTLFPLSQSELFKTESAIPYLFDFDKLSMLAKTAEPRGYLFDLQKWLTQSMLPEPNLENDLNSAYQLLQSYIATYIENEIRRENITNDLGTFEKFLKLASDEDGQIINYLSKAKPLSISPNTVKTYYAVLEDTFILRHLNAFSRSLRVQISKSPKIYFSDPAVARFIAGKTGLPSTGTKSFGDIFESFVVNEIWKQIEYNSLNWETSYLRTKTQLEADMIISNGNDLIAIEIKSSQKIEPSHIKKLYSVMELVPDIKHGIIISLDPSAGKISDMITNLPVWVI